MAINGRRKGGKAERVAAALFSTWTGYKFSKTPASGGLNWRSAHVAGDIVCTEEGKFFPFCVEVKTYKEINFDHLLYLDKPKILTFWEQCIRDAQKAKKIPLLMMRYNGLPSNFFFCTMYVNHINLFKSQINLKRSLVFGDIIIFRSTALFKTGYLPIKKILKTDIKSWKL